MRRSIDLMAVIFPFEKALYDRAGIPAVFVGHPGVEEIPAPPLPKESPADGDAFKVLLFPGSRNQEVERMLPTLLDAARFLRKQFSHATFIVGLAPLIETNLVEIPDDLKGVVEISRSGLDLFTEASLAVAASGTVTLQCALSGTPMIVLYKTSRATFCIGRRLVTIPWIAMPNVLAGRKIVPEFLQEKATPEAIASEAIEMLGDPERYRGISSDLLQIRDLLKGRGLRATAEIALRMASGEGVEDILSEMESNEPGKGAFGEE